MAFDLEMITGLGVPVEKAKQIKARHDETIAALSAEAEKARKEYEETKARAEEARRLEAEIEEVKDWKAKYEAEKAAFDTLKTEQDAKNTEARKREAYKALMRAEGIPGKLIDKIARYDDVSSFRLDAAGNLENTDAIRANLRREWEDFLPTKQKGGL